MLKNKSKLIVLILLAMLLFFVPTSFAVEETDVAPISEENPTSETTSDEEINSNQAIEDAMKKSDVYLAEDNITIDYVIDGNAFLIGNNVTINSQIGGDVFVCANNLTIGEQGAVYSNIFALANTIDIKGIAYDIYTFSHDITISGYIYRDIKVACGNLNLFGRVARNAYVTCDTMNFVPKTNNDNQEESSPVTSQGAINGNLEYNSLNEISIPENAVMGETRFTQIQPSTNNTNKVQTLLISLGAFLVTTLVIWLLCLWLTPKFLENTSELASKKIFTIIGLGLLGLLVIPIVSIILLMFSITTTIALILIALYIILIVLSSSIVAISVANSIAKKLKVNKTTGILGIAILSAIVLWLLKLIPVVGGILSIIYAILGIGIILSSLILDNHKKVPEASKTKEEN